MTHDINAAIRRMRAVIGVLDEDLAAADEAFGAPLSRVELPPVAWDQAEAARRLVEDCLRETARAAADASQRAQSWGEKAEIAIRRNDITLARQAIAEMERASEEADLLAAESNELQIFLTEWAVRVTPAPPTPPEAAG